MGKETTRKEPTPNTIKQLFALSGNQCSFKGCKQQLVDKHSNLIVQVCHIEAAEPGGERYNLNQTPDERRAFDNLILLCPNHHSETNNERIWTVSKLKDLKNKHENKFSNNSFEISDDTVKKILLSDYLENVKTELDKEDPGYAQKILKNAKSLISNLNDEDLSLEYELLECRCLQKLEKIDEARIKYKSLSKRFTKDSRALLYLAEIALINDGDLTKNLELLKKAKEIDENFWLLKLEQLVKENYIGTKISPDTIDENSFPNNIKIKSNFYRLYAISFKNFGGQENVVDTFIEKALYANPERFSNYLIKLIILEDRLLSEQCALKKAQKARQLLIEIEKVENKFFKYRNTSTRSKALLNSIKINALSLLEDFSTAGKILEEMFELCMNCYFDRQTEQMITVILQFMLLPDNKLSRLLEHLKNSKREVPDRLLRMLIAQFIEKETLYTNGKKFFTEINCQDGLNFVSCLENKNYQKILTFLNGDVQFAITIAHITKDKKLKQEVIDHLLRNESLPEKDLLYLFNDDKILEILQQNGVNNLNLNYFGLKKILPIVQQKNAWDLEVVILNKLIGKEGDEKQKFNFQLQLFNAHFNLKQYPEVIKEGKQLLKINASENLLSTTNAELLLGNTVIACFERGKIDNKSYLKAKKIFKKYKLARVSFEFKIGIEAEVYLKNNEPQEALRVVIEAVTIEKGLLPDEYAKLYYLLAIKIGNQVNLKQISLSKIKENTFVKLKNKDRWYFIGEENGLDANRISRDNKKYLLFEKKKLGNKIILESDYSSEKTESSIEFIFPIEEYVLWQVIQNFHKLSKDDDIEGVWMVEVPREGESIDLKNILKLMEDVHKKTEAFFEMYLKNNMPLAMLAVSEGGLTNAIGHIQSEQKGFINFSNGTIEDIEKQKEVARIVIKKKKSFYIDGTSALFLAEVGYLEKIQEHIPNLKVPQSVINLLGNINNKIIPHKGQVGRMGYAQKKITYFPPISKSNQKIIQDNIVKSVGLLEVNSDNILVVSPANREDCFSEQKVPAELSDACILAQKDKVPILTEDFIYLRMNELETKKKAPKHFSSLALIRVLYEDGKISFNDYIKYFGYLSSYRFRFLSINVNDIENTVFGMRGTNTFKPKNIRNLNLRFVLSEDYGVTFMSAFNIMVQFFLKVAISRSLVVDDMEKILFEIIEAFPTELSKQNLKRLLLKTCSKVLENNLKNSKSNISVKKVKKAQEKINMIMSK